MSLSPVHIETLKSAPFVIPPVADVPHDLCRRGLLQWAEGAWRLTEQGKAALDSLAVAA